MTDAMNVTVLMDAGAIPDDDGDFTAHVQTTTEGHVVTALRELGHTVRILGVGYDVPEIIAALSDPRPDLVFNLAEQFGNDRRLDVGVVSLLEMMGLRYTGTGQAGLMLCRDKGLCKQLLSLHRIRVPDFAVFPPDRPPRTRKRLRYPLIVKPVFEDGSDGIAIASVVSSDAELLQRVRFVHERFQQVAIAEEYIAGRELYVSVLGNARLRVFPAREIRFGDADAGGPPIATSRVKWDKDYRDKWQIAYGFADLDAATFAAVARVCKRAYRVLQLQDYGRIDLRLTPDNKITLLEANPNPDIAYGDEVAEAARVGGVDYNQLIDTICRLALRRGPKP